MRTQRPGWAEAAARYATGTGERAVVTLRDGTRVTLAPQTVLRVRAPFGTSARAVELDGEAYFDVPSHAARAPFVVQTGGVTARVLGTAFTVRHYGAAAATHVAVVSGKVAVMATGGGWRHSRPGAARFPVAIISAGEVAVATDSTVSATSGAAGGGVEPYTAWAKGRLVFYDVPATEVLAALTRWYGFQFRLTDTTLAAQVLTVGLSTESSAAALSTLKLALDAELTFDGNVVIVSPRRTAHPRPRALPRSPAGRDVFSQRTQEVGR